MNKTALVTGAAVRIGHAICQHLHQAGFTVAIHYRSNAQAANDLMNQLNSQRPNSAAVFQADLVCHQEVLNLAQKVSTHFNQKLDVLVNNASNFYPTSWGTATPEQWDQLFNSNIRGSFFLSQALIPSLKNAQGCIINLVDIHSEKPLADHPIYCMAKASVAMMTQSQAKDLGPDIRANGVSPGAILWPENEGFGEQQQTEILQKIPLRKAGRETDIAKAVMFLVQDAPYITGQIIAVDGGRSLNQ